MSVEMCAHVNIIYVGADNQLLQVVYEAMQQCGSAGGYARSFLPKENCLGATPLGRLENEQGIRVTFTNCWQPDLSQRWRLGHRVGWIVNPPLTSLIVFVENTPMSEPVKAMPQNAPMIALSGADLTTGEVYSARHTAVSEIMALGVHLALLASQNQPQPAIETGGMTLDQWFALGKPQSYWWLSDEENTDKGLWPCVKLGETRHARLYHGRISSVPAGDYLVKIRAQPQEFGRISYTQHEMGGMKSTGLDRCPACNLSFRDVYGPRGWEGKAIRHVQEDHPELICYP